jgi:hypothetical protein
MRRFSAGIALGAAVQAAFFGRSTLAFGQSASLPPLPGPAPTADAPAAPASVVPASRQVVAGDSSPESGGKAFVHIEGSDGTRLEQDLDSVHHADWSTVCVAPCDTWVDMNFDYRVAGGLMKASDDFSLRAAPGERENLRVSEASHLWSVVGWTGVGLGAALFAIGILSVTVAPLYRDPGDRALSSGQVGQYLAVSGVGAAIAAGGGVLVYLNRKTTVSQDVGPPAAPATETSWWRAPTWSEGGPTRYSMSPAMVVPIVAGRF